MPQSHLSTHSGWRQVLHNWLNRRFLRSQTHCLTYRNLYVLPTRAGCMLGITLLLLLLASINFQLNLGYLLTFLLSGSAFMSIWMAHRNLRGLHLRLGSLPPVFQGQRATVTLHIEDTQKHRRPRHAIAIAFNRAKGKLAWIHTDVHPPHTQTVQLGSVPHKRGWHQLPRVIVETRYPLGVFRVWSYWQPQEQILVYPAPESPPPAIRHHEPDLPGHTPPSHSGQSSYDGVRLYQRGDALRTVIWKKAATALASGSGELVVRSGHSHQSHSLWLDAYATGVSDPEAQIARLTAWVLQAHAKQWEWGLRLPSGLCLTPSQGDAHLHDCLAALATDGLLPHH